jgi:hypothetical protein
LECLNSLIIIKDFPLLENLIKEYKFFQDLIIYFIKFENKHMISISTNIIANICVIDHIELAVYEETIDNFMKIIKDKMDYIPVNDALFFLSASASKNYITVK